MTAEQTTATVETLTAEVRVLTVGKRQITVSVAKQLDVIPVTRLTVFGRVKLELKDHKDYVIGVDNTTGILSLSAYNKYFRGPKPFVDVIDSGLPDEQFPIVCGATSSYDNAFQLRWSDIDFELFADGVRRCEIDGHTTWGTAKCSGWNPAGSAEYIESEIARQTAEADAEAKAHRDAASSPLIVLAGLR
ncbi:hypothetical protein [Rhodococcus pyridinivorans]|uniref:Uncharacterized protein n=1 Tax=Rhodococcus pyridinivorans AK37 TaxID=1114960 RepID=H0JV24_9NOCA|nr:hypothetical protein [Rhodococcus pyridinivorans]EHK82120.1 hypothetical protein AK37_17775 [Rhodococcus pyridinivorans AK37]MCD2140433.1 hypothetical protein [Rhodococcus pyridinivorans]